MGKHYITFPDRREFYKNLILAKILFGSSISCGGCRWEVDSYLLRIYFESEEDLVYFKMRFL
jgi:hypothetical protein